MDRQRPPRGAYRLTFEYHGDDVRLVHRTRVDMLAPLGEPGPLPKGASGFWIELRDRGGAPLFQRVVAQPVRFEDEVFNAKRGDPIERRPISDPRGTFSLLVPDLPEAESFALVSSPPDPLRSGEPALDVVHEALRSDGKRPGRRR